jgi:Arc/MetJ-type ribon-helix-helix transcriptional regulator
MRQEATIMTIHFPPDVEEAIKQMVESGKFRDSDEALRIAIGLLAERERRLEWRRAAIARTDEQIARGEGVLLTPELMDEIEQEAEEMVLRGEMPSQDVCP